MEPPAPDPRLGMVLGGRYRIVRTIGGGGMGSVYEAEHLGIRKRVAIKALHPRYAREAEMCARFQREAEAATAIGHPNIVEVNDLGVSPDGVPYMVLELLEGRDFARDIRDEGPQPLAKVVHVLQQVCGALGVAHAIGIVHRDMKPENVFLTERGGDKNFAKVLDFGISKMLDREADTSLTETGTTVGTPQYMAPEQCRGRRDIDGRADIYALGVIMFRALTGVYPFADESYPMLVLKICTEPAPPLSAFRADVPPELQAVLDRMLAKKREDRFRTCAELSEALQPFREHHAAPAMAANPPSTANREPQALAASSESRRRASGAKLIGGAAFVLALTLGFVGTMLVFTLGDRTSRASIVAPAGGPAPVDEPEVDPSPADVEPEAPGSGAPPEESAQANDSSPSPDGALVTVHVRISATPADAHMFLDGDPIGNPFEADVPRDPDPVEGEPRTYHLLRVEAPGYRTLEQELAFRFDNLTYPVTLQRGRADRVMRMSAEPTTRIAQPVQQPRRVAVPVSAQRRTIFGPGRGAGGGNPGQTVGHGAVFGGR